MLFFICRLGCCEGRLTYAREVKYRGSMSVCFDDLLIPGNIDT